jgi:hypothetical protein
VRAIVEGDFARSYTAADNATVVATVDTPFGRPLLSQISCVERHYDAWGAEAALRAVLIDQGLLDRVDLPSLHSLEIATTGGLR